MGKKVAQVLEKELRAKSQELRNSNSEGLESSKKPEGSESSEVLELNMRAEKN